MAKRSTDSARAVVARALVLNALDVAYVPEATCVAVGKQLGITGNAALVRAALIDSARIASELGCASGALLAVLEAVAGAGGQLTEVNLVALLAKRFGWDRARSVAGIHEGAARGLLLYLGAKVPLREEHEWYVMLVAESATQLAEATLGLSLPVAPDAPPPPPLSSHRDRVARLAACAHFAVKCTRNGHSANRATLRKLSAATGADEESLHRELEQALALGLVVPEGELIVPDEPVLRAFAAGHVDWDSDYSRSTVRSWVPDDRWVSEEAVVRAAAMEAQTSFHGPIWAATYAFHRTGLVELDDARRLVSECDDLARLEHGGHAFVRRAAQHAHAGGDGHVTPNLEVMLGPEAGADLTLTIALAAEPVRFDRVLTFRLTPASVAVASAHGGDATTLLAALACVGRHGVPDNVRAMIEDWMRAARTARVRSVWSIELSTSDAADVAARALGKHVLARPTPLLLLVDSALAAPEVALAKAGVKVGVSHARAAERGIPAARPQRLPSPALDAALRPPPTLVATFENARRAGFPVVMQTATLAAPLASAAPARVPPPKPSRSNEAVYEDLFGEPSSPAEVLYARAEAEASDFICAMLDLAGDLVEDLDDALLTWLERRPAAEQKLASAIATESPLRLAPLASLAPKWRARLLRDERTIEGLIRASERLFDATHTSARGGQLLLALTAPTANAVWQTDRAVVLGGPVESSAAVSSPSEPLSAKPRARDLPRQPPAEVRRLLEASLAAQAAIWALVSSKTQGDRVTSLRVERILERGTDIVVLATDLDSDEGRSFPLSNVVAVRLQADSERK